MDERQDAVREVRVDDDQFLPRHADVLLQPHERIVKLTVKEDLLRRKLLVLHRVENLFKPLLVALLCVLLYQQSAFGRFNPRQNRSHRSQRTAHCNERPHDANVHKHGCLGAQDSAQHRHPRLGKGIGQMSVTAPT